MKMSPSQRHPLYYFSSWLFGVPFIILLAGSIALNSSQFTSDTLKSWMKDIKGEQFFDYFIRTVNHSFGLDRHKADAYSISDFTFKIATNIQPTDIRTFLGSELPGLSLFDTEIVVAGEGTDYTNLPIESAPPMEMLLKEQELAERNSEQQEDTKKPVAKGDESVFIYHSHSWESFIPLVKGAKVADEAVSSNDKINVIAVGKMLSEALNQKGIGTLHDTSNATAELKKRNWNYYNSYNLSRETVKEVMAENKKLNFLIDIHRDSLSKEITTKEIKGKPYARIFFIVGEEHKNYEQNLKVATELNKMLTDQYPGISRGVFKKGKSEGNGIYNQDLSSRAILLEFGGVENNLLELQNSIEVFAEIFSKYYRKAEPVNG